MFQEQGETMTGNEAVLFAFIFILFGSGASIATFIGVNLVWERMKDHGVQVEVERPYLGQKWRS